LKDPVTDVRLRDIWEWLHLAQALLCSMGARKRDLVADAHRGAKLAAFRALTHTLLRLVQARHQGERATERTVVTPRIPLIPLDDLSLKNQQTTSKRSDPRGLDRLLNCSMEPLGMIAASCYAVPNSMPYAMYEVITEVP
jgi:hypothetical protein